MQERDENRTFTMVLRSGEKNFEELLNINMDKDLDLIQLPQEYLDNKETKEALEAM